MTIVLLQNAKMLLVSYRLQRSYIFLICFDTLVENGRFINILFRNFRIYYCNQSLCISIGIKKITFTLKDEKKLFCHRIGMF